MFAIRNKETGELASWEVNSTDGEFCVSVQVSLTFFDGPVAVFPDRWTAENALRVDTQWYNAGFNNPSWDFSFKTAAEAGHLEVVELCVK